MNFQKKKLYKSLKNLDSIDEDYNNKLISKFNKSLLNLPTPTEKAPLV